MELPAVGVGYIFSRRGGAESRILGRIKPLDDGLGVDCGAFCWNIAGDGRNGNDFQLRLEKRKAKCQGIVDARIAIDDDLSRHTRSMRKMMSLSVARIVKPSKTGHKPARECLAHLTL